MNSEIKNSEGIGAAEPVAVPQGWRARYKAWRPWKKVLFWALPSLAVLILIVNFALAPALKSGYKTYTRPSFVGSAIGAQGSDGRVWMGTEAGLYIVDGQVWSKYDLTDSGLPGDYIQTLAVDPSGRLWVAASTYFQNPPGIAVVDGGGWKTYPEQYQDFNHATGIAFDPDGHVWIGYGSGYGQNQPKYHGGIRVFDGQNWTTYTSDNSGLPNCEITALAIDASGRAWIGTDFDGLVAFDGKTWKVYAESDGIEGRVAAIAIDSQGRVLAGTNAGLMRFDGQSWTKLVDENVTSVIAGQNGRIFADTLWGDLLFYDGTTWAKLNAKNSFVPSSIRFMTLIHINTNGEERLLIGGGTESNLLEITPRSLHIEPVILFRINLILQFNAIWIACLLVVFWIAGIQGILPYIFIGLLPGIASILLAPGLFFPSDFSKGMSDILYVPLIFGVLGGLAAGLVAKGRSRWRKVGGIVILVLGLLLGCASSFFFYAMLTSGIG